jgi:hypothetical protein
LITLATRSVFRKFAQYFCITQCGGGLA